MNRVERESLNSNSQAIKFARPAIALAIRHYKRLEKLGKLIHREVQPKIDLLRRASLRQDEIEADYEALQVDKVADRKTGGFIYGQTQDASAKYRHVYGMGSLDPTDLASENSPFIGRIVSSQS